MMHGWDSESVFLIYEIIYETRRLFPFLDQGHESISLYSLNKADQRRDSISLFLWNKVEKVKVFLYIYETRLRKWKYFFTFMKQGSESKIIYFIFMKQGSESESFSLFSWNKVRKVKVFLYFSWKKVQRVKVFLYFHETRLRNVMNRRRLATLSGEISAWSFIQHHLTSTLTWFTRRPKRND